MKRCKTNLFTDSPREKPTALAVVRDSGSPEWATIFRTLVCIDGSFVL